jgi:transcriptional regulator GlxA family with amidase domain
LPEPPPHRVGVLVFPGVTLLDVAGPTEAFTEASRYGARYSTVLVSVDGGPVRSSTGLEFSADHAVVGAGDLDTLLVPGSDAVATRPVDPPLAAAAAQLAGRAGRVASVCTGAFVLAEAGLLDGRARRRTGGTLPPCSAVTPGSRWSPTPSSSPTGRS